MTETVLREPSAADVPAIVDLLNARSLELHGESEISEEEIHHWLTLPDIWVRVLERDGNLVGYADVADEDNEHRRFHVDARVADRRAGDIAIRAAEEYARGQAEGDAIMRAYASSRDAAARAAFEGAGLRVVRHSFQMLIDDASRVPEPAWPAGVYLSTFGPDDEDAVWEAMNDAFTDHWDHQSPTPEGRAQWRRSLLDNPRFDPELWFLLEADGQLAAVSLCGWHWSGDPAFGWVHSLGVRRPWRRRGLALALLQHSFREFARRGARRVGLGVDAKNTTGAVRLYKRAGMHVARRNDTWEKQL